MSDLLPCPFCGQENIFLNKPNQWHKFGSINCPSCMVVMPGACSDQAELIEAWNNRAAISQDSK